MMSTTKVLSIIIPAYNIDLYIKDCLESIKNQDFKNFHLIIINDFSQDNTPQIINNFINSNPQMSIDIINNSTHLGLGLSRNIVLSKVTTNYIMFIDGDDFLITNTALSELITHIQKEQSDLAIFNYTKYYKKYNFSVRKKYSSLNKIFTNINDLKLSILSQSGIGTCWNKIYNTSFLKQNNILFSNYLFEDVIFFYKSILFSKKISIYSKSLYGYLKRPQSLMSTKHKNYSFVFSYYQDIFNFFNTLPNDPFYNDAKNLSLLKLTNKLFKLFKSSSFSNKSSYYIQLKNFIIKNKDYYNLISNKKLKSKIHSILTKNFLLNLIKYGIV